MNAEWNRFAQLCERFYEDEDDESSGFETQLMLFRVFEQTLRNLPGKKHSLHKINTDADSEIIPFLMDFLMEIDMEDQQGTMLRVCGFLLDNVNMDENDEELLGVRSYYASALCRTGRAGEALDFCRQWTKEQCENMSAAADFIEACIFAGVPEEGRKCASRWLEGGEECTEDNEEIYRAVQKLMDVLGEEKKSVSMLHSIEDYEDSEDMSMYDDDDFGDDDDDEEDPFDDGDSTNVFRFPSGPDLF